MVKEENMDLLNVYAMILNNCTNKMGQTFLINRIYKILQKQFRARYSKDFPKVSYELQVVNLVAYINSGKLAYAFLYASSLHFMLKQEKMRNDYTNNTTGILGWFTRLFD